MRVRFKKRKQIFMKGEKRRMPYERFKLNEDTIGNKMVMKEIMARVLWSWLLGLEAESNKRLMQLFGRSSSEIIKGVIRLKELGYIRERKLPLLGKRLFLTWKGFLSFKKMALFRFSIAILYALSLIEWVGNPSFLTAYFILPTLFIIIVIHSAHYFYHYSPYIFTQEYLSYSKKA